eukprot:NODE_24838_length_608_cov_7.557173.p3 GENE.NODE_24838_length_608_cov_7.557173~~NODE_24838_length_608_cov_7.557173.p3  ORF type:complete len:55 (+),score=6.01 NODE_24838_length_608_cov_7.557173:241-405(+)
MVLAVKTTTDYFFAQPANYGRAQARRAVNRLQLAATFGQVTASDRTEKPCQPEA